MGHDISNRNEVTFKELRTFLKKISLSENAYLASEYLLRGFLISFDPATKFPDEDFDHLDMTSENIKENWHKFNTINYPIKWGFHPLAPSGISQKIDIQNISNAVTSLLQIIPNESLIQEVVVLRKRLEMTLYKGIKNLEQIKNVLDKTDRWRLQHDLYLIASQFVCEHLLGLSTIQVNQLIYLKKRCYFPDLPDEEKETLQRRLLRSPDRQRIENKFEKFFDNKNPVFTINQFRDKPKVKIKSNKAA
jgi:hypothetical protein